MKELLLKNSRLDGRYDILEVLGQGSYAEIYIARDILASPQAPHSLVVIKALNVFLQDDLDEDLEKTLVKNFQNEAIALDRVRHPNVISRLGHGTARDLRGTIFHYLVLEYLPGGDLSKLRKQKNLSLNESFGYLEQVCAGLAHAHEKGVIHRDIKPQNLLLTRDLKNVKIADFGVARLSQIDTPVTRVGTNMYAPPEHSPFYAESLPTATITVLTPAADVYSLAKSAFAIITGESPRRFTNAPINVIPESIADSKWGAKMLGVLLKATQSNPRERYQTVQEFWRDLAEVKVLADREDAEIDTQVSAKPHLVPQASVSKDYSPQPPVRPTFNTSRDFKVDSPAAPEENPRFVINLGSAPQTTNAKVQTAKAQTPATPAATSQPQIFSDYAAKNKPRPVLRRASYLLIFALIFASALFATQNYLRNGRIFPQISNPFVKPEAIALIDINLRSGAGVDNEVIGTVPKGSRVKIFDTKTLNDKGVWSEIEITEFSRDKINPEDKDHGWVNQKYLDIQE